MGKENEHMERRFFPIELRADEENGVIAGVAAVYERESDDLGGFVEIVEPGFFRGVLESDVRGLVNHDPNIVLGRTRSGTLRLEDQDEGLEFKAFYPDTGLIKDMVIAPMKRGDINQCSFQFRVGKNGSEWTEREDGTLVRRLLPGGCEELADVSVVTFPAYPQTSAEARSKVDEIKKSKTTGEEPRAGDDPEGGEEGAGPRARLALKHRRLDLAEQELVSKE
jgi:hypothetical protein